MQERQNSGRRANWRHYRAYNRELYVKRLARIRLHYALNKDRYKANANRRRARIRDCEGSHTRADILALFDTQDGACAYCRVEVGDSYHVDHKTPLARGGSNWLDNLQITCPACNLFKGARTHEEFAAVVRTAEAGVAALGPKLV